MVEKYSEKKLNAADFSHNGRSSLGQISNFIVMGDIYLIGAEVLCNTNEINEISSKENVQKVRRIHSIRSISISFSF